MYVCMCVFIWSWASATFWLLPSPNSIKTISTNRYHQSLKDETNKLINDDSTTSQYQEQQFHQNAQQQHQLQQQQTSVPLYMTNDVQLRFLCPDDLEEVRTLCQDWFPIDYPFSWYEDITSSTRFFALAAVYNLTIIGLIVAEIKPYARLNKEVNTHTHSHQPITIILVNL